MFRVKLFFCRCGMAKLPLKYQREIFEAAKLPLLMGTIAYRQECKNMVT
jgi:hypothetical protein